MKEMTFEEMDKVNGGVKWECVGIAAFMILSPGVGALFMLAGAVVAGCFN